MTHRFDAIEFHVTGQVGSTEAGLVRDQYNPAADYDLRIVGGEIESVGIELKPFPLLEFLVVLLCFDEGSDIGILVAEQVGIGRVVPEQGRALAQHEDLHALAGRGHGRNAAAQRLAPGDARAPSGLVRLYGREDTHIPVFIARIGLALGSDDEDGVARRQAVV